MRILPPECLCEGATLPGCPSGAALWRALSPVHVVSLAPSEHGGSHDARVLGLCVAVGVVLVVTSVVAMKTSQVLSARKCGRSALHRARNLTPEKIVAYKGPARAEDTPELLSRRIIERSEQIQRALSAGSSEIEMAICAMGYSACAPVPLTVHHISSVLYSPKRLQGVFCELRLYGVLRSSGAFHGVHYPLTTPKHHRK